jgi:hypothetical protein
MQFEGCLAFLIEEESAAMQQALQRSSLVPRGFATAIRSLAIRTKASTQCHCGIVASIAPVRGRHASILAGLRARTRFQQRAEEMVMARRGGI